MVWYSILNEETHGNICAVGFKPIIHLMLERFSSVVLAQTLTGRWGDTTNTVHIAGREMTNTLHDFHYMTTLWFDGVPISLEDGISVCLGADLLG